MRRAIVFIGVLGFLLGACGGGDAAETVSGNGDGLNVSEGPASYDDGSTADDPMDSDEAREASGEKVSFDIAVTADRKVIRNVSLQLAADDTRAAYEAIAAIAEANGGFVSSQHPGRAVPPGPQPNQRTPRAARTQPALQPRRAPQSEWVLPAEPPPAWRTRREQQQRAA
jgi:hypothetical protein